MKLLQYIAPHHLLTAFAGCMANCRWTWLKNRLIHWFLKRYNVPLSDAVLEKVDDYPSFNSFFTRHLKPELRPITKNPNEIACPIDGFVSQVGIIQKNLLFQAKGFYYNLLTLLGNDEKNTHDFYDGNFATFYLSPRDYHRVHMPLDGKLIQTTYVPGKLFSVSQKTTASIPNLFTRNERLISIFNTELGKMAVIFVGAMLVGNIATVWNEQVASKKIHTQLFSGEISIARGAEVGHFKMGSTIILLFEKNKINWLEMLQENSVVRVGEAIANEKG